MRNRRCPHATHREAGKGERNPADGFAFCVRTDRFPRETTRLDLVAQPRHQARKRLIQVALRLEIVNSC